MQIRVSLKLKDFAILIVLLVPDAEHGLSEAEKKGGEYKNPMKIVIMTEKHLLAEF